MRVRHSAALFGLLTAPDWVRAGTEQLRPNTHQSARELQLGATQTVLRASRNGNERY